jgi:predicted kinase
MSPDNDGNSGDSSGKSIRLLRPSMVVLCGPAACGKSTFAQQHFRPTQIISSDWARGRVCDDERDQRFNSQAFALVHFLVEQRLTANRLCVVDSTALTAAARKELLELAKRYQVPTTLILFDARLETCLERDEKRERSVGRMVVERQFQAFDQAKSAIRQEGFDQIVEFEDADLAKVSIDVLFRPVVKSPPRPPRPDQAAPRRFERSSPSFQPRPARGTGDNGQSQSRGIRRVDTLPHVPSAPVAPETRTSAGTQSNPTATARPAQVVATQPSKPAAPLATQSQSAPNPSVSPAVPSKPATPPRASALPAGSTPRVATPPVPEGTQSSGR